MCVVFNSRAVILVMLGYVYTNEVNVNEDNACDLLDLAMHYDIPLLSESVGKYLASNIVVRNWGFLYQVLSKILIETTI